MLEAVVEAVARFPDASLIVQSEERTGDGSARQVEFVLEFSGCESEMIAVLRTLMNLALFVFGRIVIGSLGSCLRRSIGIVGTQLYAL